MSSEKTKQLYGLPQPMFTSIHKMKFISQKFTKKIQFVMEFCKGICMCVFYEMKIYENLAKKKLIRKNLKLDPKKNKKWNENEKNKN